MTQLTVRLMLSVLAASALTACVSPSYPIKAQGVALAAQPAAPADPVVIAEAVEAPPAIPPTAPKVETRALEALPPAENAGPQAVAPPAVPAAQVERSAPERVIVTRSVTGRVVSVEAPGRSYTVRKGDTLEKIAGKLDTEIQQLARDNRLKKPYRLKPGQVLRGPPSTAKAYVVGDGDTLFAIARRFSVSVDALRGQNGLRRDANLSPGRKLRLPSGYRDRGPISTSVAADGASDDSDAPTTAQVRPKHTIEVSVPDEVEPTATTTRSVTTRTITGRVVEIDGPAKRYTVRKGDNLEKIARKLDTDVDDLAKDNRLKKPYRLQPGQSLKGPSSTAKAYVVGRDDTLAGIARRFSVTEAALRQANGLRRGASVAPGRKLRLPAGYRDRGPQVVTTRVTVDEPSSAARSPAAPAETTQRPTTSSVLRLPASPQPYRLPARPPGPAVVNGAPVATPPPSDAQITQMGRGVFAWPLRGEILSGFGGRGNGPRNDGLNIRAAAGDAIRAAAAGDVVYAGDQVPGFGNLVLIKHADGWITAYGHLGRVEVRMQQKVAQGQTIGQAGSTGGVSEPQLHFEVRYAPNPQERARPVDPALVLPQ
jgi:murein DD-endopeptidase MepM/ murein hydrolase activator NlpD